MPKRTVVLGDDDDSWGDLLDGFDDTVFGGGGVDWLSGGKGDDTLHGEDDPDDLHGGAGDDTLYGGDGNDSLGGGSENDSLYGGDGDDALVGGAGADELDGGPGIDTASYKISNDGVTVSLATGTGHGGDAEGDTLTGVENLHGSYEYDDFLAGDANANILWGHGGNDTLEGGGGDDTLEGGRDDDLLVGGNGADVLDGGTGYDSADYSASSLGVNVDLTAGLGIGGDAEGDTLIGIEGLIGSQTRDNLRGDANGNLLLGNGGSDKLFGEGFIDMLFGGEGNDTLDGGEDDDHLWGEAGDDTFAFDAGDGFDSVYDFTAGGTEDQLDLRDTAYNFSSLQDVLARTTVASHGVTIDLGGGDAVYLAGVNVANLTAADFIF